MNLVNNLEKIINTEITDILNKGFEKLNLNALDYYTIMDLINYSKINEISLIKNLSYILLLMFSSLQNGSLCLKLKSYNVLDKLNIITENPEYSKNIIYQFINDIEKFNKIITDKEDQYKPIICKKSSSSLILYFEKFYNYEQKLKKEIDNLLQNNLEAKINKKTIIEIKQSNLNEKQKIAVLLSLIKNFVIISGGPGTGKTYIISFLIKSLLNNGIDFDRIKLATPTGKSAERLTESIKENLQNENQKIKEALLNIEAETIHRLLKYSRMKNGFIYNEKNKLPVDAIIIDEVSMVDVVLMSKLLSSIPENAKVIFLGDKDQLPSVEAGAVLAELIPHDHEELFSEKIKIISNKFHSNNNNLKMNDRIIILKESYRSKGNIKKLADKINSQEHDVINLIPKIISNEIFSNIKTENNFLLVESSKDTINEFKNILELFIKNFYFNTQSNYKKIIQKILTEEIKNENIDKLKNNFDELFNYNTKIKILTILKEGFYGSNKINLFIKESFKERLEVYNKNYFSGLPIIITQNEYSMQLFNGDSGIILKDKTEILKVIFKKNDDYIILPLDILPSFEISFALTIHKSQGSEYNEVFIVLPNDEENPLLTKEILYTGITRAKNKVIIYGKENVLKKAISNKIIRESGINLWK